MENRLFTLFEIAFKYSLKLLTNYKGENSNHAAEKPQVKIAIINKGQTDLVCLQMWYSEKNTTSLK
jgi:hypothetical protein